MDLGRTSRIVLTLLGVFGTSPAFAQTTDQCVNAFHTGQELRASFALREARERLALCSRSACPMPLRTDCAEELAALLRDLPSIVPAAVRSDNSDIAVFSVAVDGTPVKSDPGAAIDLDPGPHAIRFESPGYLPATTDIVVRVGERNRRVFVTLAEERAPTTPPPPREATPRSPWVWPLAGLGVVATGAFAFFGLNGLADRRDARECKPYCAPEFAERIDQKFLVADISLAVAVVAFAGAAILFFDKPAPKPQALSTAR